LCEFLGSSRGQGSQVSIEACKQFTGKVDRALAANAYTQEDRQQFGIGQGGGTPLGKALPRALGLGPIAYGHGLESLSGCRMAGF
jgi:hypothetical protein